MTASPILESVTRSNSRCSRTASKRSAGSGVFRLGDICRLSRNCNCCLERLLGPQNSRLEVLTAPDGGIALDAAYWRVFTPLRTGTGARFRWPMNVLGERWLHGQSR